MKVRKRAQLDIADSDVIGLCYSIIFFTVGTAYAAMLSLEAVLIWVLAIAK